MGSLFIACCSDTAETTDADVGALLRRRLQRQLSLSVRKQSDHVPLTCSRNGCLATVDTEPATPNNGQALTDAIVAVVRNSPTAMRPVQVTATLNSDGTTTDIKTVSSTMHYLTTQGRLTKTGRGQYIAV